MKFGRTLQLSIYAPWKANYIDYAKLKKLLREDEPADAADQWTEKDEEAFVEELVNVQLEKVHSFHRDTYEKLRERTASCEAKLDEIAAAGKSEQDEAAKADTGAGNGKKKVPSDADKQKILKSCEAELDQITKEINELEKYSRVNYTGFLKAAKKHDRKRGTSYRVRPLLQVRLAALPFNKEDYSPLIFRLSAMYSFVRQQLDGGAAQATTKSGGQEGKEDYKSYKFWVHPENLLEVKTMILRRLPVLVYNPQTSRVAEGTQPDPSITSIYFDNPDFTLYTDKIEKSAGSSLRLRWYGQLTDKPDIYFEKKTITEDENSHESRFATKDKYVQRLIKNEYHMDKQIKKLEERAGEHSEEAQTMKASVEEIQAFIQEHELQPVVRANYTRTAFQIPGDDRVRVSLDTDLAFIREDAFDLDRPCRDPDTWHRADIDNNRLEFPFSSVRKGEISRFPFAVLEVKIKNAGGKKSEWLEDIMNSHLVKAAPKFSKFVHGVATLFDDGVNIFPFWLSEMETDIRRDPQQAFEEEQAKRKKEREDEFAVGSFLPKGSVSPRTKPGVLSPVGSPQLSKSVHEPSTSARKPSTLGVVATAAPTQMDETAEEPDEDETGVRGASADPSRGLSELFSNWSTSKFAQARRAKTQLPPGVTEPTFWIKDQGPLKVEGKVWLANQRTYIKWQHVSVLLAGLSLGLYNAAGKHNNIARGLAVVYTAVALFTAGWGYGVYIWRTRLIERRSGKDFDAVAGPIVVCIGLIAALVLNFAFKYQALEEKRHHHGHAPAANGTQYGLQHILN